MDLKTGRYYDSLKQAIDADVPRGRLVIIPPKPVARVVGSKTNRAYVGFHDGSLRRAIPKVKGKAARKHDKLLRRRARQRQENLT